MSVGIAPVCIWVQERRAVKLKVVNLDCCDWRGKKWRILSINCRNCGVVGSKGRREMVVGKFFGRGAPISTRYGNLVVQTVVSCPGGISVVGRDD